MSLLRSVGLADESSKEDKPREETKDKLREETTDKPQDKNNDQTAASQDPATNNKQQHALRRGSIGLLCATSLAMKRKAVRAKAIKEGNEAMRQNANEPVFDQGIDDLRLHIPCLILFFYVSVIQQKLLVQKFSSEARSETQNIAP